MRDARRPGRTYAEAAAIAWRMTFEGIEANVLLDDLELLDVGRAACAEEIDQPLHQLLGGARARGDADHPLAGQPILENLTVVVDQVGVRAMLARDLDEPVRVRGLREPITSTRSHSLASC